MRSSSSALRFNIASTIGISGIGLFVSFASQVFISYHFGTSAQLDAYWAAFSLMNMLAFPLTPLRDALAPEFHLRLKRDPEAANLYFSRAMTLIVIIAGMGTIIGIFMAEPLVSLAVSGRQPQVRDLAVNQLYWLAPVVILLAFSETLNSVLTSYHRIILQSLARLLGLIASLVVLILFAGLLRAYVLPLSVIAAQVVVAMLQIIVLRREGLSFRPVWPRNLGQRFLTVTGALITTYAASQAYSVFEKHTFTSFSGGLVSSFQYSVSLTNVLITLVGISISNVLWPRFLEHAAEKHCAHLHKEVSLAVRLIMLFAGWLCALVWINSESLIKLIFARGAFDASAVAQTVYSLHVAVFAAVPISAGLLIGRALISLGAARSVMSVGIVTTVTGCIVLIAAQALNNPFLALSHWLLANTVGMVVYILLFSRVCGVHYHVYGKIFWWVLRWAVVLLFSGLLVELIPIYKFENYVFILDVILRSAFFSFVFIVFSWAAGVLNDIPSLWGR